MFRVDPQTRIAIPRVVITEDPTMLVTEPLPRRSLYPRTMCHAGMLRIADIDVANRARRAARGRR